MHPSLHDLINLDGKVALITGGAKGIGQAIAERLHEAGANIVLFDSDHDGLKHTTDLLLEKRAESAAQYHGDVSNEHDVEQAIHAAVEQFGGIDILINNAGIFPSVPLSEMSAENFDRVVNVNLRGTFLFTKHVSEQMKPRGGGRIVNITSIDALHPSMVGLAHYDASKHGIWGFTKNVALELAEHKIWINALAPGGVSTPGVAAMQVGTKTITPDEMKARSEQFLSHIPMHRMAEPDEIARMALVLSSDLSSYMTGTQVVVDGGALLS